MPEKESVEIKISQSRLRALNKSARYYEAIYITKKLKRPSTDAMRFGSAAHMAILEPAKFAKTYSVIPSDKQDRRTKKFKEWAVEFYRKWKGIKDGELPVTQKQAIWELSDAGVLLSYDDAEALKRIVEAVDHHEVLATFLECGEKEYSHDWRHENGLLCMSKEDLRINTMRTVVDIKIVDNFSDDKFAKSMSDEGGFFQAPHYLLGASTQLAGNWTFVYAAVEKSGLFRVRLRELEPASLSWAIDKHFRAMDEIKGRLQRNDWEETGENKIMRIGFPGWRMRT